MRYFVGIDGGQSSTVAVVGDERGRILGRGTAGPADEIGQGARSTRLRDALEGACNNALLAAGANADTRCDTIVAGVSGYEGIVYGVAPDLPTDRFALLHDAPIAHAGALGGGAGSIVIAGTGSAAFCVRTDASAEFFGGWGYLFGDDGSAFWIARNAIAHATTHPDCESTAVILQFFDRPTLRILVRDVYANEISRDRVAAFAAVCIEMAQRHEYPCLAVPVADAARALVRLAQASTSGIDTEPARVAFVGGLMNDRWFKQLVYDQTSALLPGVAIVEPRYAPAGGALLLAYKEAGLAVSELIA